MSGDDQWHPSECTCTICLRDAVEKAVREEREAVVAYLRYEHDVRSRYADEIERGEHRK
jgi:hypothetical protein